MSDDHAIRLQTVLDEHIADGRLAAPYYAEADIVAVLDELKQLRAERDGRIAQAFASGWCDALAAQRSPGWAEREAAWQKYREAVRADDE